MSEDNVEIVRRMWDAFLAGGVTAGLPYLADDVEWDGTNLPDGQIARGHQAVLQHVAGWADVWDDWIVTVEEIRGVEGEKVLVIIREQGRSSTGLAMDELHAELYTLSNGKVVHRVGYSDPRDALP